MRGDELSAIVDEGRADPELSLVRLWATVNRHNLLQKAARKRIRKDQHGYQQRAAEFVERLRGGPPPASVEPADIYAALRALDQVVHELSAGVQPYPQRIALDGGGEAYWLLHRPTGWHSKFTAEQPNYPHYWVRHHQIMPAEHRGIRIVLDAGKAASPMHDGLRQQLQHGFVRIAVASFNDGVQANWRQQARGVYLTDGLIEPAKRWASIEALLQAAADAGTHVLVLPELTVCPHTRVQVARWLIRHRRDHKLIAVVPGSFHVQHGGKVRGEAVLFDRRGFVMLRHHKLMPMLLLGLGGAHDDDEGARVIENIDEGEALNMLASPIGLVGMAVCLDFCDFAGPSPVGELWALTGAGLLLVPSMSNRSTCSAHERRARELRQQHSTVTAMANQPTDGCDVYGLVAQPGELHTVSSADHLAVTAADGEQVLVRWGHRDVILAQSTAKKP